MERNEAYDQLKLRLKNNNLIKHSLAVEVIMKKLAKHFNADEESWGLAGVLHDIDYEITANEPEKHGLIAADILENLGIDDSVIYSIKANNDKTGIERKRKMDKCLYSAVSVSDLIISEVLKLPSKRLEDISTQLLLKQIEQKAIDNHINIHQILACSEFNMSVEDFLELSIVSMQEIALELGL